jgi:hypothetical protein
MDEFKDLSNGDLGWSVCSASAWWRCCSKHGSPGSLASLCKSLHLSWSSPYITVQCSSQLWPVLAKKCPDVHCLDFGIHSKTHMWILDSEIEKCWIMVILPWFNCVKSGPHSIRSLPLLEE